MSLGTSYILAALAALAVVGFVYFEYKHGKLQSLIGNVHNAVTRVESVVHFAILSQPTGTPVTPRTAEDYGQAPVPALANAALAQTAATYGQAPTSPTGLVLPPSAIVAVPPATVTYPPISGNTPNQLAPEPTNAAGIAAEVARQAALAQWQVNFNTPGSGEWPLQTEVEEDATLAVFDAAANPGLAWYHLSSKEQTALASRYAQRSAPKGMQGVAGSTIRATINGEINRYNMSAPQGWAGSPEQKLRG